MMAFPKPAKGTALLARKRAHREAENYERRQKTLVRQRDKRCRWPACEYRKAGMAVALEVAHVRSKSIGSRSMRRDMIYLCRLHHQGPKSLHSGDLRILPLDAVMGTDGPCRFQVKRDVFVTVSEERS